MNKKERTIAAHKKLIRRYRDKIVMECPLCIIHKNWVYGPCKGCPLANKKGGAGCIQFDSFDKLRYVINTQWNDARTNEARAKFHERVIPILEKIPAERFTKKGWKFFDEISRDW